MLLMEPTFAMPDRQLHRRCEKCNNQKLVSSAGGESGQHGVCEPGPTRQRRVSRFCSVHLPIVVARPAPQARVHAAEPLALPGYQPAPHPATLCATQWIAWLVKL